MNSFVRPTVLVPALYCSIGLILFLVNLDTISSFQSSKRITIRPQTHHPHISYYSRKQNNNNRKSIDDDERRNNNVEKVPSDRRLLESIMCRTTTRRDFTATTSMTTMAAINIASSFFSFQDPAQAQEKEELTSPTTTRPSPYYPNKEVIPFSSVRKQIMIRLPNNDLPVILVNDELSSRSTVALMLNGPGQFVDPIEIPGLAHLMEHMIFSCNVASTTKEEQSQQDFEDYMDDIEGASNAFTGYSQTCFHYNCPHDSLKESLSKFAKLFETENVYQVCNRITILKREIDRVDSELDFTSLTSQIEYLTKSFIEESHPYSRFGRGNRESITQQGSRSMKDIGEALFNFYQRYYCNDPSSNAVLVIVSNQKGKEGGGLEIMQKWLTPFEQVLKKKKIIRDDENSIQEKKETDNNNNEEIHGRFKPGPKELLLYDAAYYRNTPSEQKLIFQWILNNNDDYNTNINNKNNSAIEIAFVLNQIFGRRGYGSLYYFLRQKGYIISSSSVPPQIKVPVNDANNFQLLRYELPLTQEGFLNRYSVKQAVYKLIDNMRNSPSLDYKIPMDIIIQYSTVAKLYGYYLAPRPSDAIEIATDCIDYGIDKVVGKAKANNNNNNNNSGSGQWYRFPSPEQHGELERIQKNVNSALSQLANIENALIITTANSKVLSQIPDMNTPPSSKKKNNNNKTIQWKKEDISGAQYCFEQNNVLLELVSSYYTSILDRSNNVNQDLIIIPPTLNPYIPKTLQLLQQQHQEKNKDMTHHKDDDFKQHTQPKIIWKILDTASIINTNIKIPFPRAPPETIDNNLRSMFILQLLSSKPRLASIEESANGELWGLMLQKEIKDLAELGAVAGLAYELRFNQYGLRISFLGLNTQQQQGNSSSSNLPSYIKRFFKKMIIHQKKLSEWRFGSARNNASLLEQRFELCRENAISDVIKTKERILSQTQKNRIKRALEVSSVADVSYEGKTFLKSIHGAVGFTQGQGQQGSSSPFSEEQLMSDIREILEDSIGIGSSGSPSSSSSPLEDNNNEIVMIPEIEDLVDIPVWQPRFASICSITGITLLSDPCGRVPR